MLDLAAGKDLKHEASKPLLASSDLPTVLGTKAMVGMIFFEVAGGPYGAEPVVRKGGALLAVLGFLLMPLVWSLPIAVMTAELCSDDPHVGGKIHFVHKHWGPWLGWQNGWFNAVSNYFDVATLPAMAISYLETILGSPLQPMARWWVGIALIATTVATNVIGVEIVGNASYILCLLVCVPPLFVAGLGLSEMSPLTRPDFSQVSWLPFVTALMWNTSGFDDAGASAAEVKAPAQLYPRALGISVALVSMMYVLPLGVGAAVEPDSSRWHDGYLAKVALDVGGPMLSLAISVAGFLSSVAQFNALLCTSVREIVCLAEQPGAPVPVVLAKLHSSRKTPHICTCLFGILLVFSLEWHFLELIAATVVFDCFSFVIQFATWIRFRWLGQHSCADAFIAPLNFTGVVLWSAGPMALCFFVLGLTLRWSSDALRGTIAVAVTGELLYRANALRDLQFSSARSP